MVPTITQSQIQVALRSFLTAVLPAGTGVYAAQDNRVAEPQELDFVIMTQIAKKRLATNEHDFDSDQSTVTTRQRTQITYQLDVHGPNSADNSQIISTMFRDAYACTAFGNTGIAPFYADDPKQMPFINAEQQYELRWTMDAVLQVNASVVTPQDFGDQIEATIQVVL